MEIKHLIVDEIFINESDKECMHRAVLYKFATMRWVSTQNQGQENRLGPIEIVDQVTLEKAGITTQAFAQKRLHTDGPTDHPTIHYKEPWSIPTISIYSLVLPPGYYAEIIDIDTHHDEYEPTQLGVTPEGNLFYHVVFADFSNEARRHLFNVSVKLVYNPKKVETLALETQIVEGTNRFKRLAHSASSFLSDEKNWFKLLDLSVAISKIQQLP